MLLIETSFLRQDELIGTLSGFAKPWDGSTDIVRERSAIIPGSEGLSVYSQNITNNSFTFNLNKVDYDALKAGGYSTVFVWVKPVGSAALSVKGRDSEFGLLKLKIGDSTKQYSRTTGVVTNEIIEFDIEVHKSIVSFTIDHIKKYSHGNNNVIDDIKRDNSSSRILRQRRVHYGMYGPTIGQEATFMTCGGCVASVNSYLSKIQGVSNPEVSLKRKEAAVTMHHNIALATFDFHNTICLKNSLRSVGFKCFAFKKT